MNNKYSLAEIENRTRRYFLCDGMNEIMLGIFWLALGIQMLCNYPVYIYALICAYTVLAVDGIQRRYINPRKGYLKTRESRRIRFRIYAAGLGLLALTLIFKNLFAGGDNPVWAKIIVATVLSSFVALIGYWGKTWRWYIHAGLILIPFLVVSLTGISLAWSITVPGGIILLSGIVTLSVFLRRYPDPGEEELNAFQ